MRTSKIKTQPGPIAQMIAEVCIEAMKRREDSWVKPKTNRQYPHRTGRYTKDQRTAILEVLKERNQDLHLAEFLDLAMHWGNYVIPNGMAKTVLQTETQDVQDWADEMLCNEVHHNKNHNTGDANPYCKFCKAAGWVN